MPGLPVWVRYLHTAVRRGVHFPIPLNSRTRRATISSYGNFAHLSPFLLQMRMNVRAEECRRRAAECAEKALCQSDPDIRQIYAELAEHWRALAEQTEFLQQYQ